MLGVAFSLEGSMYIASFIAPKAPTLPLSTQGLKLCVPPSGWDDGRDIHNKEETE